MELLFYFLGIITFLNYLDWADVWYVWVLIGLYFFARFCIIFGGYLISMLKKQKSFQGIEKQLNLNKG